MGRLNPIREKDIHTLLDELIAKFGIKPAITPAPFVPLHKAGNYSGMVREIRNSFGLNNLQIKIEYPERLDARTYAQIVRVGPMYPIASFPITKPSVTLQLSMARLRRASLFQTIRVIAHELAHAILWAESRAHEKSEFAVDITAMLFGFHQVFSHAHSNESKMERLGFPDLPELAQLKALLSKEDEEDEELFNAKYLTSGEIRHVAEVIRRCTL
jgi:hypothetical protein